MTRYAKIENGVVTNVVVADESFANAAGLVACGNSAGPGWVYSNGSFNPAPVDPVARRAELKARAAERRWDKEQGGITLNGIAISTDTAAMFKIRELKDNVAAGLVAAPFWFKAQTGWVAVDKATIDAIYAAVVQHVENCYAIERTVSGQIDNATITTTAQVDAAFIP